MYPQRIAILSICKSQDRYLLLRISENWKFCPGDWDFVIAAPKDKNEDLLTNAIYNVKYHTGLDGNIFKKYPILTWFDHESKIAFVLYPYLIQVAQKKCNLSSKFVGAKWLHWNKLRRYDRSDYLKTVMAHISNSDKPL